MPDGAVAPLGVALVGYGYWGPNLLRNYMELPGVTVRSVCDRRPEVLQKAQTRYPSVTVTVDLADVLADDDVDAVVIATPVRTHFPIAMAALEAGKHVFVEKPITDDSLHARRLVDLAADRSLVLMVGHTFVFSPPVRRVKELIDAGELGDIYFVTTQRVNLGLHQKDVSVIWDLATHDLSILYYWLDEAAETVVVTGRGCVTASIPDVAFVNLRFPSGVIALLDVAWLSPVKLRRTIVVGSDRMLLYDDTEAVEKVKIYDHGVDFKDPQTFGEFQLSYRTGDIVAPKIDMTEPLFSEASHFINCIETGERPITDGYAGLRVVASLESAERSLNNHGGARRITVPRMAVDAGDRA